MNPTLLDEVCRLTLEAARLFSSKDELEISVKGPRDYVTQVDLSISEYLMQRLPGLLPGSRVISEEAAQSPPIDDGYCWIVDPVDGTTNLICSLPLYAISIGLLHNFEPVLGVVYNPAANELFSATKGSGAFLNGKHIQVCADDSLDRTLVFGGTNPYADRANNRSLEILGQIFPACLDCRVTGSAALDICYVAAGRGGVFLTEGLNIWDCAGGCAILLEAGGRYTNWRGTDFSFVESGDKSFVASNKKLHDLALGYTHVRI
jgi:myo-inositol-1(or 4)-monophosphatase